MKCIVYRGGYKYQLKETYALEISIKPAKTIATKFIQLGTDGKLTIQDGYAWDGPSGPTVDTLTFMRGSLVHDALYQLMREKHLDHDTHRKAADRMLQRICLEDGMWPVRAWWVYWAVRWFANPAADPASTKPLMRAPKGCEP